VFLVIAVTFSVFLLFVAKMSKIEYQSREGIRDDQHKAKKRSISNRKIKNRYKLQEQAKGVGTSSKKLKLSEDNYDVDYDSTFGYRILCLQQFFLFYLMF